MVAADATTARLHSVWAAAPPASLGRSRLHVAGSGRGEVRPATYTPSDPPPPCRPSPPPPHLPSPRSRGGEGVAGPSSAAAQRERGRSGDSEGGGGHRGGERAAATGSTHRRAPPQPLAVEKAAVAAASGGRGHRRGRSRWGRTSPSPPLLVMGKVAATLRRSRDHRPPLRMMGIA